MILLIFSLLVNFGFGDTTRVSGVIDTNTVWTPEGSPYLVVGNILVNPNVRLEILPGVRVLFTRNKYLIIKGKLIAMGEEQDSIIFTALDIAQRWNRIWIYPEANPCSLKYCRISYACSSAIFNKGTLYIGFSTINNNRARKGGIYNSGLMTIANSIIDSNYTNEGGGICNYGTATIINSTINNNYTTNNGGGIFNDGISIITNSTINNNYAEDGGGICNCGVATISRSIINNNYADDDGGGIANYGTITITNSTINNNYADNGGGIFNSDSIMITNTTINNNYVINDGGGIFNNDILIITNSTVNNNYANDAGGSIFNHGGAIITYNTIIDSSISTIWLGRSSVRINYNNLNNLNSNGYTVYNNTSDTINARYNYWYTIDPIIIEEKIYDFSDDITKGVVYYRPFFTQPIGIEEKTISIKITKEKFKERRNLYDLTGKLVKEKKLKKGIYFLKTEKENKKVIILK